MQENTNKTIIYNSVILYIRLFVTSVCGFITTRFVYKALGDDNYGLYSLVGSIITFIAIINTVMVSASNRFIASSIGAGDTKRVNEIVNICLIIHGAIATLIIFAGIPIGDWYIYNFVNYNGNIEDAVVVFNISLIASAVSFIGVPYHGVLMARERFIVFCGTDIISAVAKMICCYYLIYYFENKLIVYALIMAIMTAYPTIVNFVYCNKHFKNDIKFKFIKELRKYREILSFSVWTGYGAIAQVSQAQLTAILVNAFFNTLMNTALGFANTIKSLLLMFSQNVTKSIAPQITKSYASGNNERCHKLVIISSKIGFMIMIIVSFPLITQTDYLLKLWLDGPPAFASLFIKLTIVKLLIDSLNLGIAEYIFATGKIKQYQFYINTLYLISVLFAYIVLKLGAPAYSIFYTYIVFAIITVITRQYILYKTFRFNNMELIRYSYLPSFKIAILAYLLTLIPLNVHPVIYIVILEISLILIIIFVGINKEERKIIKNYIHKIKRKIL